MQIRLDVLLVYRRLSFIGRKHVNPVSALGGLIRRHDNHAIGAGLLGAGAIRLQPDDYFASTVAKILRLRVALAAVAEDGNGFAF